MFYKLNENKIPVPCELKEWASFFGNTNNRRVEVSEVNGVTISTVFLGIDQWGPNMGPLLFETMIFDCPEFENYQTRGSTWDEAIEMHKRAVEMVQQRKGE